MRILAALMLVLLPVRAAAQVPADSAARDTLARVVPVSGIEVSTARAADGAPLARTTLDRKEIARVNWGQDTPMALAALPGAYAYSDAGNGIGYSYLSIRGFPQRRISVLVNGVPLNDPESHEVYWIDHPDLLTSTSEAQVQRGVGSALYGAAALGGSVDLETSPFTDAPHLAASYGYGTWNSRRFVLESTSGALAGGWSLHGRYSRIETDGYRDQSWSALWSYTLAARRTWGAQMLRVNLYGGPETTHLAYRGVPSESLSNGESRRFNPLTYPGEADHFFEPHYELIHSWAPRAGVRLSQTLFYFDGDGYYDEQRLGESLADYRLAPWATYDPTLFGADSLAHYRDANGDGVLDRDAQGRVTVERVDLVRRRRIRNHHYGWVPRVRIDHRAGSLMLGGELRAHDGHHEGTVISGDGLPPGTPPDHLYYDYHPRTLSTALFARETWAPTPALQVTGDLAWRHQSYWMRGDRFGGVRFDQTYDFALPRLGATWTPRPRVGVFASWSQAAREPALWNLFNPEQAGSTPLYHAYDPTTGAYSDPFAKPENANDWELGASWSGRDGGASANLFRMDLRDELVDYQFNADLATYITTNAARSLHQGLELEAHAGRPLGGSGAVLDLRVNGTFSDNHFVSFQEVVDSTTTISHDGKVIGFFPETMANATARVGWKGAWLMAEAQYVGRIYLDHNQDVNASTAPRTVMNLGAGVRMARGGGPAAVLSVRVLNALDRRYQTGGYFDYDPSGRYVPLYIPAATRSVLAEARIEY